MDYRFRFPIEFTFLSIDSATIFAKLRSKIVKSPKIDGKVFAHTKSNIDSRLN